MRASRILATSLAFLAWACLVSGADAAVKVRYYKGTPTFISTMPASAVEIAVPEGQKGKRIRIAVLALNFGTTPDSLGYENIRVGTTGGAAANLITYEQLQGQARTRAAWAALFVGLAAGLNTYAAARYGGAGYVGHVRYYDPVAGQMAVDRADAENDAAFSSIAQTLDTELANLDGSVLRTTTIDPRTVFGGVVVFDLPKGASVRDMVVTVTFEGDTHAIPLDNARGSLQQATAADLSTGLPATTAAPPSNAGPVSSDPPPAPSRPAAQTSAAATDPSQAPKCGMIPMDDGVKFVPCRPSRSALQ